VPWIVPLPRIVFSNRTRELEGKGREGEIEIREAQERSEVCKELIK
jgi:hypothetical protein